MGQAKRRGTFDQRKAEAIERQRREADALSEKHRRELEARKERERVRIAALPPRERKEAVFVADSSPRTRLMLAAALAASAPLLVVDPERIKR